MVEEPTFYGVDIILLPEEERGTAPHEKGKIIELNGRGAGASFYEIGDTAFYHRVMNKMRSQVGDRTLLLHHSPTTAFKEWKPQYAELTREDLLTAKERQALAWQEQEEDTPLYNTPPICNIDLEKVERQREKQDEFKPSVMRFYTRAAEELGLNVDTCDTYAAAQGLIRYTRKELDEPYQWQDEDAFWSGEPLATLPKEDIPRARDIVERRHLADIGFVWTRTSPSAMEPPILGRGKVFNDAFTRDLVGDKALFHYASQLLAPEERVFDPFLPDTFLYGLGFHTQEWFQDWLHSTEAEFYVQKPVSESMGRGVQMHTPKQVQRYDTTPFHSAIQEDIETGYRNLVIDYLFAAKDYRNAMNTHAALFQEGIPSHTVEDPETGGRYPACARAIVVNGDYMGAIWRSTRDADGDLTQQLRHNTAAGADVLPVTEEEDAVLAEIAENAVHAFETQKHALQRRASQLEALQPETLYIREVDMDLIALEDTVYLGLLNEAAQAHNVDIPALIEDATQPGQDTYRDVEQDVNRFLAQLQDISFR